MLEDMRDDYIDKVIEKECAKNAFSEIVETITDPFEEDTHEVVLYKP